jgi:hypothetical protein
VRQPCFILIYKFSFIRNLQQSIENRRLTAVGTRCADHVTPLYPQTLALTSPTGGGRSVGIVRSRTKATEFSFTHHHRAKIQGIVQDT